MNNFFSKNVKFLRKRYKLTQTQLSKKVEKDYSTIGKWENGTRFPTMEDTLKLAEVLNVNVFDLLNIDLSKEINVDNATHLKIETVKIPILGVVKAGVPIEAQQDIIGYTYMPKNIIQRDKHYFALKISGDSMFPEYEENDIVVFESANSVDTNTEAVVMVNGYDATFKKVSFTDNGMWLKPYNTNYEPKFYTKDDIERLPIRVIAKVKYFVREK